MDFDAYQKDTSTTAIYPEDQAMTYLTLGLTGEAGEVADKVKKVIRDKGGVTDEETVVSIAKEMGDVLWYMAQLAEHFGLSLSTIARMNLDKLMNRKINNQIGGEGDER